MCSSFRITGSLCTSGIACSHNSCSHSASWCTAGRCSCTSKLQYPALFAPQQMIPRLLSIQCCRTAEERRPYARLRGHDSRGYFGSLRWKLTGPLTGRRSPCVHWDCRWLGTFRRGHSRCRSPPAVHTSSVLLLLLHCARSNPPARFILVLPLQKGVVLDWCLCFCYRTTSAGLIRRSRESEIVTSPTFTHQSASYVCSMRKML